jgi:hypothetical protein
VTSTLGAIASAAVYISDLEGNSLYISSDVTPYTALSLAAINASCSDGESAAYIETSFLVDQFPGYNLTTCDGSTTFYTQSSFNQKYANFANFTADESIYTVDNICIPTYGTIFQGLGTSDPVVSEIGIHNLYDQGSYFEGGFGLPGNSRFSACNLTLSYPSYPSQTPSPSPSPSVVNAIFGTFANGLDSSVTVNIELLNGTILYSFNGSETPFYTNTPSEQTMIFVPEDFIFQVRVTSTWRNSQCSCLY